MVRVFPPSSHKSPREGGFFGLRPKELGDFFLSPKTFFPGGVCVCRPVGFLFPFPSDSLFF